MSNAIHKKGLLSDMAEIVEKVGTEARKDLELFFEKKVFSRNVCQSGKRLEKQRYQTERFWL